MTNEQQAALAALVGRPLTEAEVASITPLIAERRDAEIAAALSSSLPPVEISLPVEAVFDILFTTGDYMTLKQAQLQGDQTAAMAFAVLDDAKRLGPGKVNVRLPATVMLLDALQGTGLLSAAGRNALTAASTVPAEMIDYNTVSDALNTTGGA